MGKKSRRQRVPNANAASRRGVDIETTRRKVNSSPSASTLSPERRAAAIAAAEAELKAAIEAIRPKGDGPSAEITKDPRCERAIVALTATVTLDKDDRSNLSAYLRRQGTRPSPEIIIKAFKRWPRIRKYWPRIRRRICWGCGKEYDLSEPRLWVCGGCGEARYCDEACQRAHFPAHKKECLQTWHKKADERGLRGLESWAKLRQQFRDWYGDG